MLFFLHHVEMPNQGSQREAQHWRTSSTRIFTLRLKSSQLSCNRITCSLESSWLATSQDPSHTITALDFSSVGAIPDTSSPSLLVCCTQCSSLNASSVMNSSVSCSSSSSTILVMNSHVNCRNLASQFVVYCKWSLLHRNNCENLKWNSSEIFMWNLFQLLFLAIPVCQLFFGNTGNMYLYISTITGALLTCKSQMLQGKYAFIKILLLVLFCFLFLKTKRLYSTACCVSVCSLIYIFLRRGTSQKFLGDPVWNS